MQKVAEPDQIPVHGNLGNQNALKETAKESIFCWINKFVQEVGDLSPVDDSVYIPQYIAEKTMFEIFQNDWIVSKKDVKLLPSCSAFLRVLHKMFSHVKFLKQTTLGRCDFCLSIPTRQSSLKNQADIDAFSAACASHRELYTHEHMFYASRTETSKASPDSVLHLVFDCPDSYELPHIVPVTKDTANTDKLTVHAVGTLNHSSQERDYIFFLDSYLKNSNLTITCLFLHIVQHLSKNSSQPPVLWLQSDNASGENKNRWMIAFVVWLVEIGWFVEVMLSMLPVGHTHIDVDQMFSTFSLWLDKHSVEHVNEIVDKVGEAYKSQQTRPSASFIPVVFNWAGFFAPFVCDMSGLKSAHVFLIRKLPSGKVGLKAKKWHSTDDCWTGSADLPDEWMEVFHSVPRGNPTEIQPSLNEKIPEFKEIQKCRMWLSEEALDSWKKLIRDQHESDVKLWRLEPSMFDYAKVFNS